MTAITAKMKLRKSARAGLQRAIRTDSSGAKDPANASPTNRSATENRIVPVNLKFKAEKLGVLTVFKVGLDRDETKTTYNLIF